VQWRKNLWFLSIGAFINNIGFTAVLPFFPAFLVEMGLKENISMWSGLIISVNFLAAGLMSPVWGSFADRYGKRIMLARSGFGMVVTYILIAMATNHWQLLIYRTLNGLLAGFIAASIMLVVSTTPQERMGYALGIINTFIAAGSILGPFFGGTLVQYLGIRPTMFAAAGVLLAGTVLGYYGTKEKVVKQIKKTTLLEDLGLVLKNRGLRVYFLAITVLQITTFMIVPTLPLHVAELTSHNTELLTGILFSVVGISMAIGSAQIYRINKLSNSAILLASLLLCGILSVLQGLTSSLLILGLTRFFFGFVYAGVNVSGNVLITQCSGEEMRGRVFGILNSFTYFGAVIGPLLGGFMGQQLGNASAFHGSALFFFVAAGVFWYYQRSLHKVQANGVSVA